MHNGPGVKGTQDPKDGLPVKSRSQASRDWEGLGSLKVYLQSFLKSSGMSLKGVMQNNDIISFLFSRGQRAHRVAGEHIWKGASLSLGKDVRRLPNNLGRGSSRGMGLWR